jgi:capsular polysaccharide biosynthesis protein
MMLGLALLVIRELGDTSFHGVLDLQGSLGLPVLAAVPDISETVGRRSWLPFFGRAGTARV